MANTFRIRRRLAGGAAGAPTSLAAAELAFNEQDDTLYYGKGNSGGAATSIIPIAGPGAFAPLDSPLFTGDVRAPTPNPGDADTSVATTAFVAAAVAAGGGGGAAAAIAFRANKNGTNQSIASSTPTKLTFGTEVYDQGGYYDAANSRFTPPAGYYHFNAFVWFSANLTEAYITVALRKNGVLLLNSFDYSYGQNGVGLACDDNASGTDYYEIYAVATSPGGSVTVSGSVTDTYFSAHGVGGPPGPAGPAGPAGSGAETEYVYQFETTVPPDTGALRFDNAVLASASALYVHNITSDGTNIKQVLLAIDIGAKLLIQDKNNSANFAKFNIWALPTDNTTYTTLSVELDSEGGAFGDDAQVLFHIIDNGSGSTGHHFSSPQGRLTLQTATPVMTTTQAAKTVIIYAQYSGYNAPFYDGNRIVMLPFGGPSCTTTDTTKNPSAIGTNKVNDWFIWDDNGIIRLSHGPDWTNDTTRSAGTALARVFGLLVNQIAITNGPAAYRGTYVGTTRSNASSQFDWIYGGINTASFFGVWNAYNRKQVYAAARDGTDNWTYSSSITRAARGVNTTRHSFVCGLEEDAFEATYLITCAGTSMDIGVMFDVTNAYSGLQTAQGGNAGSVPIMASHATTALGFHFFQAGETTGMGTSTFYGDNGLPGREQSGMTFRGWM